jgi:hypothetical protein
MAQLGWLLPICRLVTDLPRAGASCLSTAACHRLPLAALTLGPFRITVPPRAMGPIATVIEPVSSQASFGIVMNFIPFHQILTESWNRVHFRDKICRESARLMPQLAPFENPSPVIP